MITLLGNRQPAFCDGMSRRNFVRIGALAMGGLSLPQILGAEQQSVDATGDKSIVMVYLPGGPTQHETFDPKPQAPDNVRGAYQPISTRVAGVQFCELLPKLAQINDKFSVVRTLTGMEHRHESFECYTGRPGGSSEDAEPPGGWPALGSVVSYLLGSRQDGIPPYVDTAGKMRHRPYNNQGFHDTSPGRSWPGFTGWQHVPFLTHQAQQTLLVEPNQLARLARRRELLEKLERPQQGGVRDGSFDRFRDQTIALLASGRLAQALDLEREPTAVRERYGELQETDSSFGGAPQNPQDLLLARRLVEAGVRCVTVAFGAWDWHANREGPIDQLAKKYLPVFDQAMSAFLEDLDDRGMLEKVSVVAWGEFGRTPKINQKGGRDHWPANQSVILAGGGIQGGRIIGTTDKLGSTPIERPVDVQEVFATLYNNLGIDIHDVTIPDFSGRPHRVLESHHLPINELY